MRCKRSQSIDVSNIAKPEMNPLSWVIFFWTPRQVESVSGATRFVKTVLVLPLLLEYSSQSGPRASFFIVLSLTSLSFWHEAPLPYSLPTRVDCSLSKVSDGKVWGMRMRWTSGQASLQMRSTFWRRGRWLGGRGSRRCWTVWWAAPESSDLWGESREAENRYSPTSVPLTSRDAGPTGTGHDGQTEYFRNDNYFSFFRGPPLVLSANQDNIVYPSQK